MKANTKRVVKGYKIQDAKYQKAMRRAKKEKLNLATLIEVWVNTYADRSDFFISGEDANKLSVTIPAIAKQSSKK